MEQSQYTTVAQLQPYDQNQLETKLKVPIFVKIIGWFVFVQGIYILFFFNLVSFIGILLIGFIGPKFSEFLFLWVIPTLIQGAGLVAVSFGIRNMGLWALYSFTLLLILTAGFFLFSLLITETKNPIHLGNIGLGIDVLALVYLWSIFKKFK